MSKKIRNGIKMLLNAGFNQTRGGKGSHRRFTYKGKVSVTICGHDGDDLPDWLLKQINNSIQESKMLGE